MKALICTDRADLTLTVNLTLNLNAAKISFTISKIETKLKILIIVTTLVKE